MTAYCLSCGSSAIKRLGMSAAAIRARQYGLSGQMHHPLDPSDLGRCLDYLDGGSIDIMRGATPAWDALIGVWGEITALYYEEKATGGRTAPKTYAAMKSALYEPIPRATS